MECKDILNLIAIVVIPIAAVYKLLETISKSLGYKDKVTWETIQNPYVPAGMIKQWQEQAKSQQAYNTLLNTMANIVPKEQKNTEEQK